MNCSISAAGFFFAIMLTAFMPTHSIAESRKIELQPTQVYTNISSQFQFPPTVTTFQREATFTQYDPGAHDIGIGYNNLTYKIAATVFIYPIAQQPPNNKLKGHFATCKTEVLNKHAGAKLLSEGKIQINPGGQKQEGFHATFTWAGVFAREHQSVRSELYVFTCRNRFVSFRFTYPIGQQDAAESAIKAFIDGLAWP